MSCPFLIHRCGVRGRTWAFPVSGKEFWIFYLYNKFVSETYPTHQFLIVKTKHVCFLLSVSNQLLSSDWKGVTESGQSLCFSFINSLKYIALFTDYNIKHSIFLWTIYRIVYFHLIILIGGFRENADAMCVPKISTQVTRTDTGTKDLHYL